MSKAAIPAGWDRKPIKAVTKITTGDKDTKDRVDNGLYPFFVRSQTVERINSVGFDGEGVLTAGDGVGTGKIFHYINGKCDFHQRVYLMHSFSEGVTGRYFFYYFSHFFYDRIMSMTAKSSVDSVRRDMIAEMKILFPKDANEQARIVAALSDADEVVAGLERVIAKKRLIKQGAMQDLLTARRRLPGFSGEWEVKRLGELVTIIMGQSPSSSAYNSEGDGLPLIQGNADIKDRTAITRVFTRQVTKIGKAGDYLMTVRAPVGEIAATDMDVCLGRGVCALRTDQRILYHIMIAMEPEWAKLSKGSTFDSVNGAEIRDFQVLFPADTAERHAVAQILDDMDAEIHTLESRLAKARAVKEGMMQNLLTGRVRLV